MGDYLLFTDASVNPQTGIGFAAHLLLQDREVVKLTKQEQQEKIQYKRFCHTSSSKLELQGLLWALGGLNISERKLCIYTDSQNIIQLANRRLKLEANQYRSKKQHLLDNHLLYKEFFKLTDSICCELIKIKGHQPQRYKNRLDHIFSLVDRAARKRLKSEAIEKS